MLFVFYYLSLPQLNMKIRRKSSKKWKHKVFFHIELFVMRSSHKKNMNQFCCILPSAICSPCHQQFLILFSTVYWMIILNRWGFHKIYFLTKYSVFRVFSQYFPKYHHYQVFPTSIWRFGNKLLSFVLYFDFRIKPYQHGHFKSAR